jgi:hypothetical protein
VHERVDGTREASALVGDIHLLTIKESEVERGLRVGGTVIIAPEAETLTVLRGGQISVHAMFCGGDLHGVGLSVAMEVDASGGGIEEKEEGPVVIEIALTGPKWGWADS